MISSIGGRGDGVGTADGQTVYVPGTVPGDRALIRIEGRRADGLVGSVIELSDPGPARCPPACPHFGVCGGCSLQHLEDGAYADWKSGQLVTAFRRAGFAPDLVAPMVRVAPGSRRRASFAFLRRRNGVLFGFNARASHHLVDIDVCPLLAPPLLTLAAPIRELLAATVEEGIAGDVLVTLTDNGLDILVEAEARLDLFDRERLAAFAGAHDLARLSWRRPGGRMSGGGMSGGGSSGGAMIEPLAHRRPAVVRFADIPVEPPPGAFLQPSPEGEQALVSLVTGAVGAGDGPVADLFAGCGSFSFPLARLSAVHAVEGDAAALAALKAASDRAGARVSAECRDLGHRPLLGPELKKYRAVVFDPPRAGAAPQAEQLAGAGPQRVVAVSCNPATLARDARILAGGGYRLLRATPVDQFPWSAHLEAVAVFER